MSFLERLLKPFEAMSPQVIRWLARKLGALWYILDRRHRTIAIHNIRLALGYSDPRARALARENFAHLAQVFLEATTMPRINQQNYRQFVMPIGSELIQQSLKLGRGVLLLGGHFGNWEWMAHCAPFFVSSRLYVVVRPLDSIRLNHFVYQLRAKSGNGIISKKNALRPILRALRENAMVGMLLDQNAHRRKGIRAPFFGGYVPTSGGLALVAIKTGAPVHPVFSWRDPSGKYHILIRPALSLPGEGTVDERIWHATALFNRCLEEQIRYDPSQWYWVHRRFKNYTTQPVTYPNQNGTIKPALSRCSVSRVIKAT